MRSHSIAGLAAVASSLTGASALTTPVSAHSVRMPAVSGVDAVAPSSSVIAGRSGTRRAFLASLAGSAAALGALPAPSFASYALYQSSYDTINERKATGDWQKSIGSDKETLADIQKEIAAKRPAYSRKPAKAPQYCAGQMSAVSPMYENMCANIGVSKADQSNSMADSFGNMNVGTSTSAAEREKMLAKQAMIREAADNARLRSQYKNN